MGWPDLETITNSMARHGSQFDFGSAKSDRIGSLGFICQTNPETVYDAR